MTDEKMKQYLDDELVCDGTDPLGEVVGFVEGSNYIMVKVYEGQQVDLNEDLYTSPPQRQPLTDEQIAVACGWMPERGCKPLPNELQIARAIEAAHGIKKQQ